MSQELLPCPFCGGLFSRGEIDLHAQLHLEEDDLRAAGAAAAPPAETSAPAGRQQGQRGQQQQRRGDVIHIDTDSGEEDGGVLCPYGCGAVVALGELNSHEAAHRLQDEQDAQRAGAQAHDDLLHAHLKAQYGFSDKRLGTCFRCGEEGHWARECPVHSGGAEASASRAPLSTSPSQLAALQRHEGGGGGGGEAPASPDVIPLLAACFRAQPKPGAAVYLSGPVCFFSTKGAEDAGWGCGYRNIQMLCSHLLAAGGPRAAALFGGGGFVPDVASLQAWLEAAWQAGFDAAGAAMFGGSVQGSRKWIGTTEAVALLRSFGVRALLTEFLGACPVAVDASGATVHTSVQCDVCSAAPIVGLRHKSIGTPNYDVCDACRRSPEAARHAPFRTHGQRGGGSGGGRGPMDAFVTRQPPGADAPAAAAVAGSPASHQLQQAGQQRQPALAAGDDRWLAQRHQQLAEWVWDYFSLGEEQQQQQQRGSGSVLLTGKPPLYLQHEGHSRTVVGIERCLPPRGAGGGAAPQYSLVVLDPGIHQGELLQSLRSMQGWQMRVKRGLRTLGAHPEFQVLHVAPGVVPEGPERDSLKVIRAEAVLRGLA